MRIRHEKSIAGAVPKERAYGADVPSDLQKEACRRSMDLWQRPCIRLPAAMVMGTKKDSRRLVMTPKSLAWLKQPNRYGLVC